MTVLKKKIPDYKFLTNVFIIILGLDLDPDPDYRVPTPSPLLYV
jgi:hypothetical protein